MTSAATFVSRTPAIGVAAIGAVMLIFAIEDRASEAPQLKTRAASVVPKDRRKPAGAAASYSAALQQLDMAIRDARQRADEHPDEWLMHELLARKLLSRARLSGSYDDYAEAQRTLDRAFAVAAPGTGPHMTQAILHFAMHRLSAASRYLDAVQAYAVPPPRTELAEIAALRGEIAFYSGRYDDAIRLYAEADRLEPGSARFQRAIYAMRTGRPDEAIRHFDAFDASLQAPSPMVLANLELQRGIVELEHGRRDRALARFRKAAKIFPGYWLIEEHIAEVTALTGDHVAARETYQRIVERTQHPEYMDALADLATQRGDGAGATLWRARAAAAWRRRLAQFPEAAYGHALDHCAAKSDWRCALDLAMRNNRARPNGDSLVKLADALLNSGRTTEAQQLIEKVLASPWRTAELHAVAHRIFGATGDPDRAEVERRRALALNPHIL